MQFGADDREPQPVAGESVAVLAGDSIDEPVEAQRGQVVAGLVGGVVDAVEQCLGETAGPVVAATDYMRTFAEQIRAYVPRRYVVLGTDGFGRSDTREKLRHFFEVDRTYVTVAALKALADEGALPAAKVSEALKKYGIDPAKPAPWTV